MKSWTLILLLVTASNLIAVANNNPTIHPTTVDTNMPTWSELDEALVLERLRTMDSPIALNLDDTAKEYIRRYSTYGYRDTEKMLGRTTLYFSIFEHYLQQYGLPQQLKYIPLVESNLNPKARSSAGAAGLWQLMRVTADGLGLSMGKYLDERRDPYKATEAAVTHLRDLYDQFNDWELALAAYNCGAGNVRKAIRNAGGKRSFSSIRRFLPSETQKYIPRFIAASYIAENYHFHELSPELPDFNLRFTSTAKVYSALSFSKLSSISGAEMSAIRLLNPMYSRELIPASKGGNFFILPEVNMKRLQNHLKYSDIQTDLPTEQKWVRLKQPINLVKSTYTVEVGDTVERLSTIFKCTPAAIREWNTLNNDELYYQQQLMLFVPKSKLALR